MLNLALTAPVFITSLSSPHYICAAELSEVEPTSLFKQAIKAYKQNDFQTALKLLDKRSKLKPEDANVYYYLGNCFLNLKQNTEAAHMFSHCVRLSPNSQAGKYSLNALETLSSIPNSTTNSSQNSVINNPNNFELQKDLNKEQIAAKADALMSEKALDKSFNEAVASIKSKRQTLKIAIDHIWEKMQDEMESTSSRNNSNYAFDLEKIQREAETKVQSIQTQELRYENRLLGPEKIDIRAIPSFPGDKADDTKIALGSLLDYYKQDKPFDPFATEITPDITSKFLSIKDVFGELSTYQEHARKFAKQIFYQLKSNIENKQDILDKQILQLKERLVHDLINIKINYGDKTNSRTQQISTSQYISNAKIPRKSEQVQPEPQEQEIQQATERSKKRIKELEDTYIHEIDLLIASAKEKLGSLIHQAGHLNSQLKHPSGSIQLIPLGTDAYTRNYINFADRQVTLPNKIDTKNINKNTNKKISSPELKAKQNTSLIQKIPKTPKN